MWCKVIKCCKFLESKPAQFLMSKVDVDRVTGALATHAVSLGLNRDHVLGVLNFLQECAPEGGLKELLTSVENIRAVRSLAEEFALDAQTSHVMESPKLQGSTHDIL